jgi:hypothetical protein
MQITATNLHVVVEILKAKFTNLTAGEVIDLAAKIIESL